MRRFSRRRMRAASRRLARFSSRWVSGAGGRASAAGAVASAGSAAALGSIVADCLFASGSPSVVDCLSSSDDVAVVGPAAPSAADDLADSAGAGWMASVGVGVAGMAAWASSRRRAAAARARIDRAIALSMRGCRRVNTTVSASVNSTSAFPFSI